MAVDPSTAFPPQRDSMWLFSSSQISFQLEAVHYLQQSQYVKRLLQLITRCNNATRTTHFCLSLVVAHSFLPQPQRLSSFPSYARRTAEGVDCSGVIRIICNHFLLIVGSVIRDAIRVTAAVSRAKKGELVLKYRPQESQESGCPWRTCTAGRRYRSVAGSST